ncbi:hypothetical protein EV426DRAFT_571632 [Tirmania nivea]|nr:hypothetical protein EV426DRAFT_571632 [Tirmania nivea]
MHSVSSSSKIPVPVPRVSSYKGTPQFILRVLSTADTCIQCKTTTILREELGHYEELVQAQEATIANLQAMLQRERLEHEHDMKIVKIEHEQDMETANKGFERLQEVAVMAVDTLATATMNACKVEHKLKEEQMEMAINVLQQKAMEMLAIIAENDDTNTKSAADSSSPPSYKELLDRGDEEVPVSHPEVVEDKILVNAVSLMNPATRGTVAVLSHTASWRIPFEAVEGSVSSFVSLPITYNELPGFKGHDGESSFEEALIHLSAALPDLKLPFERSQGELVPWYDRAGNGPWGAYTSALPDVNACRRETPRHSLRGTAHKALKSVKKIFQRA